MIEDFEAIAINQFYRDHPPDVALDDLGIYHEREVPLPACYKRQSCKCGIIHKWEDPSTFELYEQKITECGMKKTLKRCKTCIDTLLLVLDNE